jgi:hypothetical protein
MKNTKINNSDNTSSHVIVLAILLFLASSAGVLAQSSTIDSIPMEFYGECDEFYIESEHGAYTLSSSNASWNIVDRKSFSECMNTYIAIKDHTCEVPAIKSWDHYDSIITVTPVNIPTQSIYITQDIAHIEASQDTFGIITYNLVMESIGQLVSSTSKDKILDIIARISHVAIYNEWEQVSIQDNTYKWLFMKQLYQLQFMDLITEG